MNSSKFAEQRAQPGTSKAGLKWTLVERLDLFESMRKGVDVDAISKLHKRTPGAIQARMNKEFVDAVKAGETPTAVASRLRVPVDVVVSAVMKAEDLNKEEPNKAGPSMKAGPALKKKDYAEKLSELINYSKDPAELRKAVKLIEARLLELCPPGDESDPDSVAPVLRGFAFKPRSLG